MSDASGAGMKRSGGGELPQLYLKTAIGKFSTFGKFVKRLWVIIRLHYQTDAPVEPPVTRPRVDIGSVHHTLRSNRIAMNVRPLEGESDESE